MASEPIGRETAPLGASVKYNPHLWGADELREIFVVRQPELQRLQAVLRAAKPDTVPQHVLITGQRGMGKSTLLQRVALAVREDAALRSQWIPLTFPEEQYTVSTLAEFWLDVLDALADALQREGASAEELAVLDRKISTLGDTAVAKREEAALETLTLWVREHKRGVLLLIDSTDQLFASLGANAQGGKSRAGKNKNVKNTPKAGSAAGSAAGSTALWRLRKSLSHETGIFWVGASYQALESSDLYHDTFHNFFELMELRPLSLDEMRAAMLALARAFGAGRGLGGDAAVAEMTRTLDARPERLRALRALTGGNPRTTVMLYELLSAANDDSVHGDITRLLDLMTPLYKARLESLSEQPRKILAHVLEHWAPVGVGDLAKISGIPNTTVSGQLARLEAEGLIEKTRLHGTTRSGYQASERFFNVWYLMRYAARRLRQRLSWLIEFMRLWYGRDELSQLATSRASRHALGLLADVGNLEFSRAMAAALSEHDGERLQLEWAVHNIAYRESRRQQKDIAGWGPGLYDTDGDDKPFASAEDYHSRLDALDAKLMRAQGDSEDETQSFVDAVKGSLWLSLPEKEAIAADAHTLTPEKIRLQVSEFLAAREKLSKQVGEDAVKRVIDAVCRGDLFPDFPDSKVACSQLLSQFKDDENSFCYLLSRYVEKHHDPFAEQACRHAITFAPVNAVAWRELGSVLGRADKHDEEAENAFRKAIQLNPQWARPWRSLGTFCLFKSRYAEAADAYRKASELDSTDQLSLYMSGLVLHRLLDQWDKAEVAFRKVIDMFPGAFHAWLALGNLLEEDPKRYTEAETAYRTAITALPGFSIAWVELAKLLHRRVKRYDEAEVAYRKAIELDQKYSAPLVGLGNLLQDKLQRYDEAEDAYQRATVISPEDSDAFAHLARLFALTGKREAASEKYRQAVDLVQKSGDQGYGQLLLQAHLWLGNHDLARQAIERLARHASSGGKRNFALLREQCHQCDRIGLGVAFANLMDVTEHAGFLQPLSLALRAAASGEGIQAGAAPEITALAEEVLRELLELRA